ncbi:variant erythrocyte surface antigen-1 family protein [Babesia caballi]|uniref:Variant erythrocyte surface antigen-1 family protein n=1 Tax=Babesia caballi TaxID=5871 RepID=A0AAV4LSJ3_BABCB|nr:variant erythrocyte surface antigen-1 family protein [Babesia caballi]
MVVLSRIKYQGRNGYVNGARVADLLEGEGNYGGEKPDKKPITSLVTGLTKFIGYKDGNINETGIGKKGYRFSYANHLCLKDLSDKEEEAVRIFLGFIPLLYFGLSFLYWRCKGEWSSKSLSQGPLRDFIGKMGFDSHFNEK